MKSRGNFNLNFAGSWWASLFFFQCFLGYICLFKLIAYINAQLMSYLPIPFVHFCMGKLKEIYEHENY